MRKKKTLYEINRWNRPAFMPDRNLFNTGGQANIGLLNPNISASDFWSRFGVNTQLNNPMNPSATQNLANFAPKENAVSTPLSFKEAFSKTGFQNGLKAGAAAGINAASGIVGGLANGLISGGLNSGVGSTISGIGSTVGGAIGAVNPLLGAAVTVGSGILGGVTNALFGESVDEEKLQAAREGTAQLNSFTSNAGSFDDIRGPQAVANVEDAYSGGLFTSGSARRKNEELKRQRAEARMFADRSILNNVLNLQDDQLNDALANYTAYGGPIDVMSTFNNNNDMGAIEYKFMSDYINAKNKSADNKGQMTNMFAGMPSTLFSLGGNLFGYGGPEDILSGLMSDVDTRSDTTRQGHHEGTAYYGAGKDQAGDFPLFAIADAIDRQTNMSRPDSPIYRPDLVIGEAPSVGMAKAAGMIRSAKEASKLSGKNITPVIRNAQGKRSATRGAITANDIFPESQVVVGQGIKKATEPFISTNPGGIYSLTPNGIRDAANAYVKNNKLSTFMGSNGKMYAKMPNGAVKSLDAIGKDYATGVLKAFGGDLQTNGGNYSTGLTHIDAGLSHEMNPNDGVQMGVDNEGVPNLVEEGEVIYDDYVFSNRLVVPRGKRGNYGKRNKYAKGGKLNKEGESQMDYSSEVLKPFEGLTFAEAAKKAEKQSGVNERPNDPIAQRGLKATLDVLAGIQEKEREKEKLREIQETIDNMSPEEFAMLLQQMEAQLAALQQQEMAMLQQLMIPLGMELMQPVEQQQPIAALGGLLNIPDNMYPYGGNLKLFREDLKDVNVSEEDYLRTFYNMLYDKLYEEAQDKDNIKSKEEYVAEMLEKFKLSPEEVLSDENFDKDFAETFLNRVETLTKQYNRRAKRQGIKVDNLLGAAKAQYNRDLNQAILKGLTDADYDVVLDTELTFNNSNVSKAKDKQGAYNNAATYNDLIARGGRAVELDDLGRPTWESITGLNRIDNSNDNFYTNLGGLNGTALEDRGIYDYNAAQKSSIDVDDYKNVKLRSWNKNEDGTYTVSGEYDNPNQTSLNPGNSDTTYPIADIGDLKPGSEEYDAALKAIQDNKDYLDQTKYVKEALESANGDIDKLKEEHPDVLNYIQYLDANSGNVKGKLIGEDGKLSKTAVKDYTRRREDSQYGIYHYLFDDAKNAAANRYYYKDKDKDGKDVNVYISKPKGTDFTISENPTVVTGTDGTLFNDYEVTGLNKNRTLTLLPTGEVVDVTNINDKDNWEKLDRPVLTDNTDNLGYGIKGTTDWVDYGSSPAGKGMVTKNDPFPKAASWPYEIAAGLLLGSLGYNILKPADYSNADALLSASKDAGLYRPVEFRPIGNYLPYKPLDIWYELNRLNANARATDRAILNSGVNLGSKEAALLASGYNNQLASGNLYRQALEYNDALRKQVGEFNKDTDKFNSEGFLKADMANQDAASRAAGYTLEGKRAAYAMREAIDYAKANAISARLSGLGNLAMAYGLNKWNLDVLRWKLKHNQYPISLLEGYKYDPYTDKPISASKGGKLKKRHRGLGF